MNTSRRKCIICNKAVSSNYRYHVLLCFNYYKLNLNKSLYYKLYNTTVDTYVKTVQKNKRLKQIQNNLIQINNSIKNIIKNKYTYQDDTGQLKLNYNTQQPQQQQPQTKKIVKNTNINQDDKNNRYKLLNDMKKIINAQTELLKRYMNNKNIVSNTGKNVINNKKILYNTVLNNMSKINNGYKKLSSYSKNNRMTTSIKNNLQLKYKQVYIHDYGALVKGKSLIIVGPSKTVMRKKNADFINSFNLVVRLNKSLPIPYYMEKFIGYRTDILYNNCNTTDHHGDNNFSIPTLVNNNVRYLRASYPPIGVFKRDINMFKLKNKNRGFPFGHINTKYYQKINNKLKTRPYTGTLAILDLLQYDIKVLYVTGIDFFKYNYHNSYRVLNKEDMMRTRNGPIHKREPQINLLRNIFLTDSRLKVDDVLENILLEKYIVFYNKLLQSFQSYFSKFMDSINTTNKKINIYLLGKNASNFSSEVNVLYDNSSVFYMNTNPYSYSINNTVKNPDINTDNIYVSEINKNNIPRSLINYSKKIFGRGLSDDCLLMIVLSSVIHYNKRINDNILEINLKGYDLYGNKKNIEEYLLYKYLRYKNFINK